MRVGTRTAAHIRYTLQEDHPHACGDKCSKPLPIQCACGSSPCVWGQEHRRLQHPSLARIIPMRVGTSRVVARCTHYARDHPHACGDKQRARAEALTPQGSSPCVWGQVICNFYIAGGYGIIPMRVGTRSALPYRLPAVWDHPHACGDK